MHPQTIFTKTAKGVLEVKNRTIRLPRPRDGGERGDEQLDVHARARDGDAAPFRREAEARRGIHVSHRHEEDENHADLADARSDGKRMRTGREGACRSREECCPTPAASALVRVGAAFA